jgi:translation initiation factor eIF-2B subunit delta
MKVSKPNELFSHLPQYKTVTPETVAVRAAAASIPPECVRLGLQMADGTIRGTNARCGAMLDAFAEAIRSFQTPSGKIFAREFGASLNAMVAFLVFCRPLSPAMGNVIKAIKAELGRIGGDPSLSDGRARASLLAFVASFSQEKVRFAQEALARQATDRIAPGDIVVTFARSSTVEAVLLAAAGQGVEFATVIVDARPLLEGRALMKRLLEAGIPCEYVLINGVQGALSRASKVLLGAAAIMSNGTVLSRVGTAAVAMAAADAHVPVIVCAETYKFHERVQLDCITYNELADPEALTRGHGTGPAAATLRQEWTTNDNLSMLNLVYDATPAEFVTMVVTEVGVLPPSSVPVVIREFNRSAQESQ